MGLVEVTATSRTKVLRALSGACIAASISLFSGHAHAEIQDVRDLGNEINGQLQSISRILNDRSCLTQAEVDAMIKELEQIRNRLGHDDAILNPDPELDDEATHQQHTAVYGLGHEERHRIQLRVTNYFNAVKRLINEVEHYPRCTGRTSSTVGWFVGGQFVKSWQDLVSIEKLASSGQTTNQFHDNQDPLGFGVVIGKKFSPWAGVSIAPFASIDYLNMSVNHTFIGGSFLGTLSKSSGTAGLKMGPELSNGVWLYGIAGASFLNETLNVNFLPVASSTNTTVAGATLGVGGAIRPSLLQGFALPVSLFAEYQHTWWQDATFNNPTASPFFNYTFRREDDVLKFGFIVMLDPIVPGPVPAPNYPLKAPRK